MIHYLGSKNYHPSKEGEIDGHNLEVEMRYPMKAGKDQKSTLSPGFRCTGEKCSASSKAKDW